MLTKCRLFYYWIVFAIALLVALQGCASQPVSLQSGIKPDYLELCLDFAGEITIEDKLLYLDAVKSFIGLYNLQRAKAQKVKVHEGNAKNAAYELRTCSQTKQNADHAVQQVTFIIQRTRYVTPSEQALYVLISSVGVYSLLSGGYGFAWAGLSTTTLGVSLSPDISGQSKIIYRQFSSWPYFHDLSQVKKKQMKQFQQFMFELFNELKVENTL